MHATKLQPWAAVLFLFPKHFLTQTKTQFTNPLPLLSFQRKRRSAWTLKTTGGHGIGSPANRRVEFSGSGSAIRDDGAATTRHSQNRIRVSTASPIWREKSRCSSGLCRSMDGVGQSAVCGAPSDPLNETRNPRCSGFAGEDFALSPKRAVSKSHSPNRVAAAKPLRGQALVSRDGGYAIQTWIAFRQRNDISNLTQPPPGARGSGPQDAGGSGKPQTKNRSLDLRFYSIPQTLPSSQPKTISPTLALLSSCGGWAVSVCRRGRRAGAAGLGKNRSCRQRRYRWCGRLAAVRYQIGADKTVGAAGASGGARLAKGEAHLDLAAIPATVDGARRGISEPTGDPRRWAGRGLPSTKGLLVRASRVAISRAWGGIEQAEQLGETMFSNAPPRSAW